MKKNTLLKLAGALLVLTLITTTLVSGTYAKYVTTVTGKGTVSVATWKATLNTVGDKYTDSTTFDLFGTSWSDAGVDGKLLAPGTTGSFNLAYDTTGSQVKRTVSINLKADADLATLTYLTFTYAVDGGTPTAVSLADLVAGKDLFTTTLAADATTGVAGTITVTWAWPFSADATQDGFDTADGVAALKDIPFTAIFTATQLDN